MGGSDGSTEFSDLVEYSFGMRRRFPPCGECVGWGQSSNLKYIFRRKVKFCAILWFTLFQKMVRYKQSHRLARIPKPHKKNIWYFDGRIPFRCSTPPAPVPSHQALGPDRRGGQHTEPGHPMRLRRSGLCLFVYVSTENGESPSELGKGGLLGVMMLV